MSVISYVLPLLIIGVFVYAFIKKVPVYQVFTAGVKSALELTYSLFPAILAVILMSELFKVSGLYSIFLKVLSPVFNFFGIPIELIELIILKPFSGSGSLALLNEIYKTYGTSGYIPLCASAIFGSSETIFYVTAIYYVKCKNKNAVKGIIISLTATFITTCFACLLCRLFV